MSPTRPEPALSPPGESGRLPDVVQLFLFESPRLVLNSYFGPTCVGIMTPFLSFHFFVSLTRPDPALSPPGESGRLHNVVQVFLFESPHPVSIRYFGLTRMGFMTCFCVFIFRVADRP